MNLQNKSTSCFNTVQKWARTEFFDYYIKLWDFVWFCHFCTEVWDPTYYVTIDRAAQDFIYSCDECARSWDPAILKNSIQSWEQIYRFETTIQITCMKV